jgi:hypothetical protein
MRLLLPLLVTGLLATGCSRPATRWAAPPSAPRWPRTSPAPGWTDPHRGRGAGGGAAARRPVQDLQDTQVREAAGTLRDRLRDLQEARGRPTRPPSSGPSPTPGRPRAAPPRRAACRPTSSSAAEGWARPPVGPCRLRRPLRVRTTRQGWARRLSGPADVAGRCGVRTTRQGAGSSACRALQTYAPLRVRTPDRGWFVRLVGPARPPGRAASAHPTGLGSCPEHRTSPATAYAAGRPGVPRRRGRARSTAPPQHRVRPRRPGVPRRRGRARSTAPPQPPVRPRPPGRTRRRGGYPSSR